MVTPGVGLGALPIFITLGVVLTLAMIGALVGDEPVARTVALAAGPANGGQVTLIGLTGIVGGMGLLRRKMWGRALTMAYAVMSLFSIPIGTAFGIYALWVLTRDETIMILRDGPGEGRTPDIVTPIDRAA